MEAEKCLRPKTKIMVVAFCAWVCAGGGCESKTNIKTYYIKNLKFLHPHLLASYILTPSGLHARTGPYQLRSTAIAGAW